MNANVLLPIAILIVFAGVELYQRDERLDTLDIDIRGTLDCSVKAEFRML
jgi:hypothetical protein